MIEGEKHKGFSLIELLTAMGIVAILAGIAYPGYIAQAQKARRADAKIGLNQLAQQLERCFTEFDAYNNANCAIVGANKTISVASPDGHYTLQSKDAGGVEGLTAVAFVLYAVPVNTGQQAKDPCGTFSLDNSGKKTPTTTSCWE